MDTSERLHSKGLPTERLSRYLQEEAAEALRASSPGPKAVGQLLVKTPSLLSIQEPLLSCSLASLPELTNTDRKEHVAQAVSQHRFAIPVAEGSQDNRSLFIFSGAGWEQLNICGRLQAVMDIACHAAISSRRVQLTGRLLLQNGNARNIHCGHSPGNSGATPIASRQPQG